MKLPRLVLQPETPWYLMPPEENQLFCGSGVDVLRTIGHAVGRPWPSDGWGEVGVSDGAVSSHWRPVGRDELLSVGELQGLLLQGCQRITETTISSVSAHAPRIQALLRAAERLSVLSPKDSTQASPFQ